MLLIEGILKDCEEANLACLGSSINDVIPKMVQKMAIYGYFQGLNRVTSGGGGSKI